MNLLIIEETLGAEIIKWVAGIMFILLILAVIAYPIVGSLYHKNDFFKKMWGENWKEMKKKDWEENRKPELIAEWKKHLPWIIGYLVVLIAIILIAVL